MFNGKRCIGEYNHKYKPRFEMVWPERLLRIKGADPKDIMEKRYICDVCEWCGKIINRRG